jgi:hypothetical protein
VLVVVELDRYAELVVHGAEPTNASAEAIARPARLAEKTRV